VKERKEERKRKNVCECMRMKPLEPIQKECFASCKPFIWMVCMMQSIYFEWFANGLRMVCEWVTMICEWVPILCKAVPMVCEWFANGLRMVCEWFANGLRICEWFANGRMVCEWFASDNGL